MACPPNAHKNLDQLQWFVLGFSRRTQGLIVAENFEASQGVDAHRPRPVVRGGGWIGRCKPPAADELPDVIGLDPGGQCTLVNVRASLRTRHQPDRFTHLTAEGEGLCQPCPSGLFLTPLESRMSLRLQTEVLQDLAVHALSDGIGDLEVSGPLHCIARPVQGARDRYDSAPQGTGHQPR
jgi:hypothetical protein